MTMHQRSFVFSSVSTALLIGTLSSSRGRGQTNLATVRGQVTDRRGDRTKAVVTARETATNLTRTIRRSRTANTFCPTCPPDST